MANWDDFSEEEKLAFKQESRRRREAGFFVNQDRRTFAMKTELRGDNDVIYDKQNGCYLFMDQEHMKDWDSKLNGAKLVPYEKKTWGGGGGDRGNRNYEKSYAPVKKISDIKATAWRPSKEPSREVEDD